MNDTTSAARAELIELAVQDGIDREIAERMTANLTDEQVDRTVTSFKASAIERDALRARLTENEALRKAVCPPATWKTPDARYNVAKRAIKVIEAYATKHEVGVDDIAATLVAENGTIADAIAMWNDREGGYDPRTDGYDPTPSFYALRFRIIEAIEILKADEIKAERQRVEAEREAAWARQGLVRCDRCGGVGGASHWPGYTCYDCGGVGAVPAKR